MAMAPARGAARCRGGSSAGLLPAVLLVLVLLLPPPLASSAGGEPAASSLFGRPVVPEVSATCAAVEFEFRGSGEVKEVYVFAGQPGDIEFVQWGAPLPVARIRDTYDGTPVYRVLMRHLPPGEAFQVKISASPTLSGDESPASEEKTALKTAAPPVAPSDLQLHRSDPRLNLKRHDNAVCVDLHWSHPHPNLRRTPSDVYFSIRWHAVGEPPMLFCRDEVGHTSRNCGVPLSSVQSALPSSYATICGLRSNRTLDFAVEALNCDLQEATAHFRAVTPPGAPDVVMTKVTTAANQESIAGFHPMAVLDWVPQINPLIKGHAIYLGLAGVFAMKLLCFVPHDGFPGHLELPIEQKNHTHSKDSLLIGDAWNGHKVHQEQELLVATRVACLADGKEVGYLESPSSTYKLGDWLIMSEAVKCLTSFTATQKTYVEHPVVQSWTQEEALALYD